MSLKILVLLIAFFGQFSNVFAQHYNLEKTGGTRTVKLKVGKSVTFENTKGEHLIGKISSLSADGIQVETASKSGVKTNWAIKDIEVVYCETFLGYARYFLIVTGATIVLAQVTKLLFPNAEMFDFWNAFYLGCSSYGFINTMHESFSVKTRYQLLYFE